MGLAPLGWLLSSAIFGGLVVYSSMSFCRSGVAVDEFGVASSHNPGRGDGHRAGQSRLAIATSLSTAAQSPSRGSQASNPGPRGGGLGGDSDSAADGGTNESSSQERPLCVGSPRVVQLELRAENDFPWIFYHCLFGELVSTVTW
mmetsp:Transcript_20978/g.62440  ORF Transcript_20978/g.62440 Transcript_20978/m.62440 type:complete len:145 (+) Transcript_20978:241-675(+)